MLGLLGRWLLSKWIYGLAVAAVLAIIGGVYQAGWNAAWRVAEVETLKTRIETLQHDLDIAGRAADQAVKDIAELEREKREDDAKIQSLLDGSPPFPDDVRDLLRDLATP